MESKLHEIYEIFPNAQDHVNLQGKYLIFHINPPDCFSTPLKTVFGLTNTPLQNT